MEVQLLKVARAICIQEIESRLSETSLRDVWFEYSKQKSRDIFTGRADCFIREQSVWSTEE